MSKGSTWQQERTRAAKARAVRGFHYFVYCVAESDGLDARPCKIGMTTNIKGRLQGLQSGNWRKLFVVWNRPMPFFEIAKSIEERTLIWFRPSYLTDTDLHGSTERLASEWLNASAQELLDHVDELLQYAPRQKEAA